MSFAFRCYQHELARPVSFKNGCSKNAFNLASCKIMQLFCPDNNRTRFKWFDRPALTCSCEQIHSACISDDCIGAKTLKLLCYRGGVVVVELERVKYLAPVKCM